MEVIKEFEPLFGEWYVDAFIGEGSFGKVYRIYREELGVRQFSALKHFSIPQDDKDIVQRRIEGMDDESISKYYSDVANDLRTEINLMKKMQGNANIVCFEDSRILPKENGMGCDVFIRMELLTALTTKLAERQMEEDEVKKLGMDICSALKACRENAIIHRDIKPDNIFIDNRGNYKLGDFGISRQLEKTATFMSKKGTYNYMAPEVYKGERYGAAADIYSLGIVMYNLLNGGRVPFLPLAPNPINPKDREYAVVRRMRGDSFPLPCTAQNGLGEVVLKACAFYPYDRYKSAEDFSRAISEAGNETSIDPDQTLAMFGEKPSFTGEEKKPPLQAYAQPVRPVNPQGGVVPPVRPVNPQGGIVPPVRPVNPQEGFVPKATQLQNNNQNKPNAANENKTSKKTVIAIIAAVVTLVIIAVVVIGLNKRDTSAPTWVSAEQPADNTANDPIYYDGGAQAPVTEDDYYEPVEQTDRPTERPTEKPTEKPTAKPTEAPVVTPALMGSGSCGSNLEWELGLDGTLTISGYGAMEDYGSSEGESAPWYDYRNEIITLDIGDNVTIIGEYSFKKCAELTSINIGSGVQKIKQWAFHDCDSLRSITIPGTVERMDRRVFWGCNSLSSVELEEGVTTIGSGVFADCPSLSSVSLPSTLESVGAGVFQLAPRLKSIEVSSSNRKLKSVDGVLYSEYGKTLAQYPAGRSGEEYVIPDGVTKIANAALSGSKNLKYVFIPESMETVCDYAFNECNKLVYVCFWGPMPELVPNSEDDPEMHLFSGCDSIEKVIYSADYWSSWNSSGQSTWQGVYLEEYDPYND